MKKFFLFTAFTVLLFSCKKEERYNPDKHITYAHWYKLSGSADTLFSVYIPSAFTPSNEDGCNDYFYPKGYFNLTHFRVYNKFGGIIFETSGLNARWDGRENASGNIVSQGAYTYQFIVKDVYGIDYEYTGSVMLYK